MTVSELIENLKQFPQDLKVVMWDDNSGYYIDPLPEKGKAYYDDHKDFKAVIL